MTAETRSPAPAPRPGELPPVAATYVEAPAEHPGGGHGIFLAGGISGCANWQAEAVRLLADIPVALFNPRRADFPLGDPNVARAQIEWEFRHLRRADVVLFWFAAGPSPQPITLFELGSQASVGKPLAVGADPDYIRRIDVVCQLGLLRPDLVVHDSLEQTCAAARALLG